ncbi:MAG: hypothetical protein IJZ39_07715 [Oscillospiraceae bacterium]|nr:hypothetical protein [Oscillospiraceae bacterium]
MFKRYHRAQKWLQEQNPDRRREQQAESESENGLPSMEELRREMLEEETKLDKSDWFALMVAAFGTILIPCALFLLFIVGVAMWIF